MAETENNTENNGKSLVPHFIVAVVVVLALVLAFVFLPGDDEEAPQRVEIAPPVVTEPDPEPIMETLPPEPEPIEETITLQTPVPMPLPEPEPEPEPEPLDLTDAAIKTALVTLSEIPEAARVLVDEDLLRRFVVFTNNLADEQLAENHHLLRAPGSGFRVYRQAGKEWIDSASYQRYTLYAEILDSMETETLLELYETYKPAVSDIFAEISAPDDDFDERLIDAIDHLLDTPEIPVPVEVYTDSVMYKYRIDRIEDLTAPQKQLLRTGPENMRLIKAKLREIRDALLGG